MLRIKALGSLTIVGPDGPIVGAAAQPKRMALLALLARAGERGVTRDKVLGYFWPDAEEDRARRSLANMVWALRRDLGAEELFLSGNDLRLNPEVMSADVDEFETALAAGDLARAATLYEGPFLDGFRIAGVPEFDRWVDGERMALAHEYVGTIEKLARGAESKGDWGAAVGWWRKVAAQDPLNARLALGLMRSLAAAGDRAGALRHAQIYEALVEQDLELPPDREVVAFAKQLRETIPATATAEPVGNSATPAGVAPNTPGSGLAEAARAASRAGREGEAPNDTGVGADELQAPDDVPASVALAARLESPAAATPRPDVEHPARTTRRRTVAMAAWGAAAVVVVAGATLLATRARRNANDATATPVIALGRISDYRQDRSTEMVKPLTDMLATALARSPELRVVSTARMYELASQVSIKGRDSTPDAYVTAARAAGATELLDGALYALDDSTLRLDLRRIDLATGNVRAAHSVTARGPFALADSGTARLLADLGAQAPTGSIADVTTRSLAAYRFYDEGLRAFYQDDIAAAERLFAAAVAEDSMFASAAYYLALSVRRDEVRSQYRMLERAVRLAEHASDRERLTIRANWEVITSTPSLRASAESLITRYPQEVEGHLFTGIVRVADGAFLDAVPHLERAIAMDSLSLHGQRSRCTACEAFRWVIVAYELADSLPAAEREVRRWMRLQPGSGLAYGALVEVLMRLGRIDEGVAAWRDRARLAPGLETDADVIARLKIQGGAFEEADALMRSVLTTGTPVRRINANWYLAISERYQGRYEEALAHAREYYRISREARTGVTPPVGGLAEAQALLELGRGRESAAIFDAIAYWTQDGLPSPEMKTGMVARHRAWHLTHAATALASVGDTAELAARADTIERYGAQTLYRLHRQLHHHVRGLLLAARGRDDEAIAELRQAVYSLASGYTRTNYELGRILLRRGRAAEAIAVVQPALRSGSEATSFYVTQTELHELLAYAWDSLGVAAGARRAALPRGVTVAAARDSAVMHYRWVARAWAKGDSACAVIAERAGVRATSLAR